LSLLGLAHITASLSVLLWAVEPLLILLPARWLLPVAPTGGQGERRIRGWPSDGRSSAL
jgi:hypothetical protein